uniref:Coiled-coil domain-containing protein n=1 Tax=Lotus japonicus TaxID=34305 RepID=I3S0K5_LOTJA|nr:unknown [Lotus japonicus]
MSSLAAARADNFYYPPEWDPSQGSLNNFHGQHALRERARKLDQGILIIRFEMPFNIWCGGCNSMIGKGVRFNAEKKQVGNYYSTKIWSFTMKSACCRHEIVIQTDPKNCEYVIISGAQKKTEDYDVEDAEVLELATNEERSLLADPFYRLEHGEEDLKKKKKLNQCLCVSSGYLIPGTQMTMLSISLSGPNLEVKRKELLKKRLLPGKGALAYDYFLLQNKMQLLQNK